MNGRFRFTPEAEAQLAEIIDFIAADSEDAARQVLNGIHEALDKLAEMPAMDLEVSRQLAEDEIVRIQNE